MQKSVLHAAHQATIAKDNALHTIKTCQELCGRLLLAEIIDSVVQTRASKRVVADLKTRLYPKKDGVPKKYEPIYEFEQNGETFEIMIKMQSDIIFGEEMTIQDFNSKYGLTDELEAVLELANNFIIKNVQQLFLGMTKMNKANYPQFSKIAHSDKVRGLYFYEGLGNKSFRISIVKKE